MKYTPDQQVVLNRIKDEDWNIISITGSAGTGKTTLLNEIKSYFLENKSEYQIYTSAFTGRAAAVLREKGLNSASTIHYRIWGRDTMYKEFGKYFKLYKFKEPRDSTNKELWIIDECSMLSEKLLICLLLEIYDPDYRKKHKKTEYNSEIDDLFNISFRDNIKIIFTGDPKQLPPVVGKPIDWEGDIFSNLFSNIDKEIIFSKYSLEVLHRHSKVKEIHELAVFLSNNKSYINKYKIFPPNESLYSLNNIEVLDTKNLTEVVERYQNIFKDNKYTSKYISFQNDYVHEFNTVFRTKYFDTNPKVSLLIGEIIHVTKNNYFYDLWNGDYLEVIDIEKNFEGPSINLKRVKETPEGKILKIDKTFSLNFIKVKLRHLESLKEYSLYVIEETLSNKKVTIVGSMMIENFFILK